MQEKDPLYSQRLNPSCIILLSKSVFALVSVKSFYQSFLQLMFSFSQFALSRMLFGFLLYSAAILNLAAQGGELGSACSRRFPAWLEDWRLCDHAGGFIQHTGSSIDAFLVRFIVKALATPSPQQKFSVRRLTRKLV